MRSRFDSPGGGSSPPLLRAPRAPSLLPASTAQVLPHIPIDPRRWRDVLLGLLELHNWSHGRKAKGVSHKTIQERREFLFRFFRDLRQGPEIQYRIDPRSLASRHVQYAVDRWVERGLAPVTIQTYLSHLRVFSSWIAKPGLVLPPDAYVADPSLVRRTYVAKEDRGWSANGVDLADVLARLDVIDLRVGAQLRLCGAFGLRVKEAIMLRPHSDTLTAEQARGRGIELRQPIVPVYLHVSRGTKGGRARVVPVDSDVKHAVLAYARDIAGPVHGHLGDPALELKQSYHRYFNVLRTCGITRAQMGVTSHGLRHEFAHHLYEAIAGAPAPLRGGQRPDKAVDDHARSQVAADLGHGRKSISSAYLGGLMQQGRLNLAPLEPTNDEESP